MGLGGGGDDGVGVGEQLIIAKWICMQLFVLLLSLSLSLSLNFLSLHDEREEEEGRT